MKAFTLLLSKIVKTLPYFCPLCITPLDLLTNGVFRRWLMQTWKLPARAD